MGNQDDRNQTKPQQPGGSPQRSGAAERSNPQRTSEQRDSEQRDRDSNPQRSDPQRDQEEESE